jgi:leader peptidase (prepilin peptidase)/N-methyltransferase
MGRSHCPKCDHSIGWLELIPVIGYIVLLGRCRKCKTHISIKYPLIELITGILFLVSYVILSQNMIEYILIVLFISLMTIVTVSDLYYKIVPDIILIIFLPLILVLRILSPEMVWYEGIIGAFVAFAFLYVIAWYGEWRYKQIALGGGDIKLYFIIGLVLGYKTVFLSLFIAALAGLVIGLITRKREMKHIPFVPFIYFGSMIAYFYGEAILSWYMGLFL